MEREIRLDEAAPEDGAIQATMIVARCRPILAGHHPGVQAGAIADLLSILLAGHPAELREFVLEHVVDQARELLPANERMLAERR